MESVLQTTRTIPAIPKMHHRLVVSHTPGQYLITLFGR